MDYSQNEYNEREATLIYDCHTVNASTSDMTETEVKYFCGLVRKYIKDKFGIDSEYRVNTITYNDKENPGERKLRGVSYIYWKASEAYHIILGNRPDGTSLTRQVEVNSDGEEMPKSEISSWDDITSKPASSWDDIMDDTPETKSWADMSEPVEAPVKSKKIITIKEDPLIPDFVYNRNNGTKINIAMQALFTTTSDEQAENYDMFKLSGLVPKETTVEKLHLMFDIFSNKSGYPQIEIKQTNQTDTYSKNIAFITFCPGTNDAKFAREIMLFTKLQDKGKEIITKFDHPLTQRGNEKRNSYKNERNDYRSERNDYKSERSERSYGKSDSRGRGRGGYNRGDDNSRFRGYGRRKY